MSSEKMKQIERFDRIIVDGEAMDLPSLPQIPEAVSRFCNDIDRNFVNTIVELRETAKAMHFAANELEMRAKELETAGPDLSEEVKKWIVYERESREKQKFYSSLFK